MKKLKELPLVLFSLMIPGLAMYCSYAIKTIPSLVPLCLLTLVLIGFSSIHLGNPFAAPKALRNLTKSNLSREMFFTGTFFLSMVIQILFFKMTTPVALIIAALGIWTLAAISAVYVRLPRVESWIFSLDYIVEFNFVGNVFCFIFSGYILAFLQWEKGLKDIYLGIIYYRRTGKKIYLFIVGVGVLTIALAQNPISLLIGFINSLYLRYRFFESLAVPNLKREAEEYRASYLPAEYQKYFKREC